MTGPGDDAYILGEFPGFVHDSFSFDFPGWKGKISQNKVIVCIMELFTHSFAWTELEKLRWLFHGKVVVLHQAGSVQFSVVYQHSLPGTSFKAFLSVSKAVYCCSGRGLNNPSSLLFCLYPCFNNDSNANCHSPFIPKTADFLRPDTEMAS